MDRSFLTRGEGFSSITSLPTPYIFATALVFLLSCCVITRIKTGLQAHYATVSTPGTPRAVPVVPYWIPFIGHTISFGLRLDGFLKETAYSVPSGIFALKIAGGTHNIITGTGLVRELLNRPNIPASSEPLAWRFMRLSFGDQGLFEAWNEKDHDQVDSVTQTLHGFMKEPFLTNAIAITVKAAEDRTWNLISGNPSWVDHSGWERAGQVQIVSSLPKDGSFVAEADLYGLIRHFVGDIASTVLMGKSFVENNPTMLDDLWLFDSKVPTLMLGLPWWITPGVPPAVGARERLLKMIIEHHQAMIDTMEGREPSYHYSDLSDVSDVIWQRLRIMYGAKQPPRLYGAGNLLVLWLLNVNALPITFWLIFYIYSDPILLRKIRTEIEPYVQVVQPPTAGLPIKPAPQLKIDITALMSKCVILKGTFLEAMRLQVAAATFRVADDDFTINESKEDAARENKSHPEKYLIRKGEVINIAHIIHQEDARYYPDPQKFDPERHLVRKRDEKGEEVITAEYGNMRPWGGGKKMCKGRNFAEREVLSITAAILALWDIEPADKTEGWKHPGNVQTAGTYVPKKDIRVRMRRRKAHG